MTLSEMGPTFVEETIFITYGKNNLMLRDLMQFEPAS